MNKKLIIATVLLTAALTGILSTNLIAFGQDESATNTRQSITQENEGSGESTNNNCALNSIDSTAAATVACPVTSGVLPSTTLEELPSTPEIE
jgi:hypothetical protein